MMANTKIIALGLISVETNNYTVEKNQKIEKSDRRQSISVKNIGTSTVLLNNAPIEPNTEYCPSNILAVDITDYTIKFEGAGTQKAVITETLFVI